MFSALVSLPLVSSAPVNVFQMKTKTSELYACTNATVLTQLGMQCEFLGSLSRGVEAEFVCKHLRDRGVCYSSCVRHADCATPTSCVTLSLETGSRTVVHARNINLPELSVSALEKINLSNYDWVHFEGRGNEEEIVTMIDIVEKWNSTLTHENKIIVSVELEKPRETLLPLLDKADVVFTSKDYARFCGYSSASEAVKFLRNKIKPGATMSCAWGEKGADGAGPDGDVKHSDAYSPEKVIDTLGAGDTFVAGAIFSLIKESPVGHALIFACSLAVFKCGVAGNDGLVKAFYNYQNNNCH